MEAHKRNLAPQPMAERKGGHGIQVLEGFAASPSPSAFQLDEVSSILYCSAPYELVSAQTRQPHPEMVETKSQNKPSNTGDVGLWGSSVSLDCISWSSKSETRWRKKTNLRSRYLSENGTCRGPTVLSACPSVMIVSGAAGVGGPYEEHGTRGSEEQLRPRGRRSASKEQGTRQTLLWALRRHLGILAPTPGLQEQSKGQIPTYQGSSLISPALCLSPQSTIHNLI